jgi:hypothetical protein
MTQSDTLSVAVPFSLNLSRRPYEVRRRKHKRGVDLICDLKVFWGEQPPFMPFGVGGGLFLRC